MEEYLASMTSDELCARWQRCQRALSASPDGFWERDLRTQGVWYSPGFLSLFGFRDGDLPAARGAATARVHPEDQSRFRAAYREALRTLGRFDYEVRFRDAAGQWRWVHGSGRVWPDADGRPEFISGAVSDIHRRTTTISALEQLVQERTARLEAALALAEQRRLEAERANAAKSRFLAHMSHEIRTPLNGVLGLTELALLGAEQPEQRRFLTVAKQSGEALRQVISDVLDFSRIEADRVELRRQPVDLVATLAETLRAVMPLARPRDLQVLFDWEGDTTPVLADEGVLRQIVTNLLGNAIKFTAQGHVALTAAARREDAGQLALTLRVADTGPGVPPRLRQKVFEAFEQGDDSPSRAHGGSGLGLTIAHRLAQALGGELRLDCPPEGGSVFTLTLRLPTDPDAAAAPAPAAGAPGLAWLVEPRALAGQWLARRLQRLGWTVARCASTDEALQRAAAAGPARPGLLLLGVPALHEPADLARLRQALPGARMHLLIRPDWHQPALERQARALGITPLLMPLTPPMLHALAGAPADEPGTTAAEPPAAWQGTEVLLVEDNPVNQMVGEAFLRALGLQVHLAASGREALDACRLHRPGLVLMDLQMPDMDGLEATRQLIAMQREGRWPGAPIVALTAHASDADRCACREAGMHGVLTKPLSLDTLRQQLGQWLPG